MKNYLQPVQIEDTTHAEIIWVCVNTINNSSLIIGNCYRPETDEIHILNKIASSIERVAQEDSDIILTGDFNVSNIDWDLMTGKNNTKDTFLNIVNSNLLN